MPRDALKVNIIYIATDQRSLVNIRTSNNSFFFVWFNSVRSIILMQYPTTPQILNIFVIKSIFYLHKRRQIDRQNKYFGLENMKR